MAVQKNKKSGGKEDEVFDASPDGRKDIRLRPEKPQNNKPNDMRSSPVWKKMQEGMANLWLRYKALLATSFSNMSRYEQENLITRFSFVVSIGIGMVVLNFFYSVLPTIVRVIALPIVLSVGWYIGTRIVAPAAIDRLEKFMHPPEY